MAETRVIPTTTIATSSDTSVTIYTFYNRNYFNCNDNDEGWTDEPYIKESVIAETFGYKNGVQYKEGDLLITAENAPALVDYWLDNNGNLIIKADNANNYYIDDNGDLIYDLCGNACEDEYYECEYIEEDYI